MGERQRVEILKALYRGARILILDEPTAVLTPQESEALFATLGQMVAQGLSIIFISHKLAEVLRVSHRVAVLRGGKLVAEARAADTTQAQLAQWMVGQAVDDAERRPAAPVPATPVCALDARRHAGRRARPAATTSRCTLRAGEIVAIAGVSGNGQVALAELLCGVRRVAPGSVRLLGEPLPRRPGAAGRRAASRASRKTGTRVGVVGDLPVWENAVSERLRTPRLLARRSWVRRGAARRPCRSASIEAFDVRGGGPLTRRRARSRAATCRS